MWLKCSAGLHCVVCPCIANSQAVGSCRSCGCADCPAYHSNVHSTLVCLGDAPCEMSCHQQAHCAAFERQRLQQLQPAGTALQLRHMLALRTCLSTALNLSLLLDCCLNAGAEPSAILGYSGQLYRLAAVRHPDQGPLRVLLQLPGSAIGLLLCVHNHQVCQ